MILTVIIIMGNIFKMNNNNIAIQMLVLLPIMNLWVTFSAVYNDISSATVSDIFFKFLSKKCFASVNFCNYEPILMTFSEIILIDYVCDNIVFFI